MRLRELFIKVYLVIIILLTVLIVSSIFMHRNNIALIKSNDTRYKSFAIAEALRKSSDDLTSYSRMYVETGDSIWEKKYWEVLGIRSGERASANGKATSLRDSMKRLGFTATELDKLKEAEQNSNTLVWTERVAFNALKGLFADSTKKFTTKGKPDTLMAHSILYDTSYLQCKVTIMKPIDECIKMVEERTCNEVENNTTLNRNLLLITISLIIIISLFVFISFFVINKRIKRQFDELQKAKESAVQNEVKFRYLFEKSPDIILVTTLEGNLLMSNPAGLKFHMANSVDKLNSAISSSQIYVNPNDRNEILEELKINSIVHNKEVKLKSLKGNLTIDSLISCELVKTKENETVIVSWVRDISEKVKSENTIRKLSAAVSQNPAAIVITDLKGNIEYVNQQFSTITGYSYQEAIGCNPRILKAGTHSREFYKNMWNTILSGETWNGELYNKRKDGSLFWEAATIAPILNDKNEIINIVAIKQDITAKKEAELALVESQKKLKELNDTKNKLFSIIGHDLRGPIGNLKSFIELIVNDADFSDTQNLKQLLEELLSSTSTTYDLLENLLLWAKSQQNEVIFMPVDVELHQTFEMSIALIAEAAKRKSITIHNQIPNNLIIHADRNMIMTITRNLISNAIKFTESGKNIYLSVLENGSSFTISIKDEGVGINPEDLKELFNPTKKHTTSGTSGEKGTGLGLLLCKEFVEKHNGKIWAESEQGNGSEFKFTISKTIL